MAANQLPENPEGFLLDDELGLLEPAERDRLEQALSADTQLEAKQKRLADTLEPLDAWDAPAPPPNLTALVMARIETIHDTIKLDPTQADQPADEEGGMMPVLLSLREIVAIAAAILIIVGVFVPSYYGVHQSGGPAMTGADLGGISQGLTNYAGNTGSVLPASIVQPGASWLSPDTIDDRRAGTRHPYLRVSGPHVNSRFVIAPAGIGDGASSAERFEGLDEVVTPNRISYRWHIRFDPAPRSILDGQLNPPADKTPAGLRGLLRPITDLFAKPSSGRTNSGRGIISPNHRIIRHRVLRGSRGKDGRWPSDSLDLDPDIDADK